MLRPLVFLTVGIAVAACNAIRSEPPAGEGAAPAAVAEESAKAPPKSEPSKAVVAEPPQPLGLDACADHPELATMALRIKPDALDDDAGRAKSQLCTEIVPTLAAMSLEYQGFAKLLRDTTELVIEPRGRAPKYDGNGQRLHIPANADESRPALLAELAKHGILMRLQFTGVRSDVALKQLGDWRVCYTGTYDDSNTDLTDISKACHGKRLLVGCGTRASGQLALAAIGDRKVVLTDTGSSAYAAETSNGVDFYFHPGRSMGFAPAGSGVNNNGCDVATAEASRRLCWHLSEDRFKSGFRCGEQLANSSADWQRYIFHAD